MAQFKMFLTGCVLVCITTLVINLILRKQPQKADKVIDYIMYVVITGLLTYAIAVTDWTPVEEKLSEDLKDYRETQKNVWKLD